MTLTLPKYSEYLLLVILMWMVPDIAYAQTNSVANVLCGVVNVLRSPVGMAIAVLGVISIGLIAMFGKIQISSLLTVLTGIAILFGAPTIVTKLTGITACGTGVQPTAIATSQFLGILSCMVGWFLGPIGKTLATMAILLMGLFAGLGRVSWHQALLVGIGIATMFGSISIVESLGVPLGNGAVLNISSVCLGLSSYISIEGIFCNVVGWFNGTMGKAFATITMIVLGLGALFGKTSWTMATVVALSIALIFGSVNIVDNLGAVGNSQHGLGQGSVCSEDTDIRT